MRKITIIILLTLFSLSKFVVAQSITIGPQDDNWHLFSIASTNIYTLSYDFSEHNFDSDAGESDGWRQSYGIDWNSIITVNYSFVVGDKFNPEFLLSKSSISFTSTNQTGNLATKVLDSDYGDNTGNIYVDLSNGPPNFSGTPTVIGPQNSNWHSFNVVSGNTYRIDFDFSEHNFDSDAGESDGWRQSYGIDWNSIETVNYSFVVGDKFNPEFLLSYSSITFVANQTGVIKVKINDSAYEDNTGNVYVYFNQTTVGVTEIENSHLFNIYPNPTNENLRIESVNDIDWSVNIVNSLGQRIYMSELINKEVSIDMINLTKGLYFVEIIDTKGNILLSDKIIKR